MLFVFNSLEMGGMALDMNYKDNRRDNSNMFNLLTLLAP